MQDELGTQRLWLPNGKTPGLSISRSFGDFCVKHFGLISMPDVTQRSVTNKDLFVILATDGVSLFTLVFCLILNSKSNYFVSKVVYSYTLIMILVPVIISHVSIYIFLSDMGRGFQSRSCADRTFDGR